MAITIENLENAFEEMFDFITDLPSGLDGFESDFDAAFKELEELKATLTPPNDWVSADERLPENYTDVLCWYEYFRYGDYNRMYQTYGIGYCINGQWGGEVSNGTKCKVLYWQPMPAPPDRRPPEGDENT